jgi:ubiquitin-conjugating enzyme E2 I
MSTSTIATNRLTEERKNWRKDHPPGFHARPEKREDNSFNLMKWEAGIPGKADTDWAGGVYRVSMEFPDDYPSKPPKCKFVPPLYHPNVYPSGTICLSILNEDEDWRPSVTIKTMLLSVQDLLTNPNEKSPAQREAYEEYVSDKEKYKRKVREQAQRNLPSV